MKTMKQGGYNQSTTLWNNILMQFCRFSFTDRNKQKKKMAIGNGLFMVFYQAVWILAQYFRSITAEQNPGQAQTTKSRE